MRIIQHLIFWSTVSLFLVITFGQANGDFIEAFYFVTFLLPVALATSYFFNYFLVPSYLLTRRYVLFGLYFAYTLIFSIYLEMIVLTIALIVLANYTYANLNPYSTNLFLLTSTLYFIVFLNAFILLIRRYQRNEHLLAKMEHTKKKNEREQIIVRVDRKNRALALDEILYIESLADYVKIHTTGEVVITKEKISELHDQLPERFIRTHRSFLVNQLQISEFGKEELLIGEVKIPISRTYRKAVSDRLRVTT
ncbi:LytTR family DNA-binding domain-containing protein [Marinoscillum sp. 108]|uniref:LytR/AlgR family response regulator transcription factor n=1 Tax=Marinoscillum sp. 108 TaxID=2653151 RepID=UPI0012F206E4|nr:LytTR family DNA-binding domain-containing protein [Marinoscillum sp. 108]VXD15930.1 conserved membrane hypothetical protein [Marinoscillum sp. 108]